ncbi:GmrSD restriction endonuclease domain-containing protein [Gordonia neofelifaecis]|uniref:DUF262 domain-containing protein n=1 Tax=Gordonia neofelifaecis NRRL B-59395 TaxID=644548 RepID=F1YDZ9_9ACTN|nr:DUF262 domain-containing protein [Gordonia neofelifaecis]EGD57089.1 hypothetical protein SCNU_01905 [Gordonia neofelifaecis NRRL B-59395]
METNKRTPQELFIQPQHFVIPLFQRGYVWKQEEQWEPLWKDVCRVADFHLAEPGRVVQHFLGAVVLQGSESRSYTMPMWNVIDGQQRLTTLQIMMDAVSAAIMRDGTDRYGRRLEALTHNSPDYVPVGESRLKLRHLNNDRAAFDEVMDAEPPVDYPALVAGDSLIVRAHQFFTTAAAQWLGDVDDDRFVDRAEALATVLQSDLQLVTIELAAAEDSQEIFETLNARGTPLTAADLVRNFVFQRIEAEGGDAEEVYKEVWPFETKFWAAEVSIGRYLASRSSVFINQWLMARTGEDVRLQATFTRFKSYVAHLPDSRVGELLPVIKQQADAYEGWTNAASRAEGSLDRTELAVYRMKAAGSEVLKPLLIWLHEPARQLPSSVIDQVVGVCESWVQRRQLLRLTNTDIGRVVADLMRVNTATPADELVKRVTEYLSRLNFTSSYWPGDAEVRSTLVSENVYRRFPRPRLRSLLEAIENEYRAETGQPQVPRSGLPIEHILPQKWEENWPVGDDAAALRRQDHVHRLGNLTLLTQKLNSKVSNSPWPIKRSALLQNNTLTLTGRLIESTSGAEWDEEMIDQRTESMIDTLLTVWPVPDGHTGTVLDPQSKPQEWVELKHLIDAGLLAPGEVVQPVSQDLAGTRAIVTAHGTLALDGREFSTPSGAGHHVRKRATNGWHFWVLDDGRKLNDLRADFLASKG